MTIRYLILLILTCFGVSSAYAQTTVSGTVTDATKEPLIGANVVLKGTTSGTTTDLDGNFILAVPNQPPFVLVISYIGYAPKEVSVTAANAGALSVTLEEENSILQEVVISASRVEEKLLESPVSIEKLDLQTIKTSASVDFFDQMSKLKGVTTASGSMTFNAINTRGFGGISNTRFVQLVDGIDNTAPLLNFPLGNLIGLSELDVRNVELVPGAASALYGPNAFNGIMLMTSKNPFDYQGLSVSGKIGVSDARNGGTHPMYNADLRYAKAWDKFAFKVAGSYFGATDWLANDYSTDINSGRQFNDQPNFNGVNLYGDESVPGVIPFNAPSITGALVQNLTPKLADILFDGDQQATAEFLQTNIPKILPIDIRRSGFKEEDLLDNRNASSIKATAGLFYRPLKDVEVSYNFRLGSGNSIYQGSERYALRNFLAFSNKLEVTTKDLMVRTYMTQTKDGDSYNMTALGSYTNELLAPSRSVWVPNYIGNYAAVLMALTGLGGTDPSKFNNATLATAHEVGRDAANEFVKAAGLEGFKSTVEKVRNGLFQRITPELPTGGAGFVDASRLFHTEGTYDFSRLLKNKVNILVGANHRLYSIYSEGTIFNEDPDGDGTYGRIKINEFGAFVQASKKLFEEKLKLTASIRFDKNENFKGQITPRISAVASLGDKKQHNIRASFQTGFRNPDTQAQFIFFDNGATVLLGGTQANAEQYGLYKGGAYTKSSYDAFTGSLLAGQPNPALLKQVNLDYVKPERLSSIEVGYKAIIKNLYIDWNFYFNMYNNFITQTTVVNKNETVVKGSPIAGVDQTISGQVPEGYGAFKTWRPYVNIADKFNSWGSAIGLSYKFNKGYIVNGNYSYMDFDNKGIDPEELQFNTPNHMFNLGISNNNISNSNVGASISYRWQADLFWTSDFGTGTVESFGTLDASLSYNVSKWKTVFKVGATNIAGPEYRTNIGGPWIGRTFFAGFVYDGGIIGKK